MKKAAVHKATTSLSLNVNAYTPRMKRIASPNCENTKGNHARSYETSPYSPDATRAKARRRRIVTAAIIATVIAILMFVGGCSLMGAQALSWLDPSAREGSYIGKTEEEIKADLNARVKEGSMIISICSTIRFPNGSLNEGIARIENSQANPMDQKVQIVLDSNNKVVYQSGAISPGYTIDNIKLNSDLDPGTYSAIALFTGYNKDTHREIGSLGAAIKIVVE